MKSMFLFFFTLLFNSSSAAPIRPLPTTSNPATIHCQPLSTKQLCAPSSQDDPKKLACEMELKASDCEAYVKLHPELASSEKLRNCDAISVCENPQNVKGFLEICATQMGQAWKDMAVGTFMFLTGQAGAPSEEDLSKLEYFKNCTSPACKRQMLGPFEKFFSKEEIEGHPGKTDLNPDDPANKNYLQGYSSAVLYRKLLMKLKKESQTRTLDEKFIEPWSGNEARLPLSFSELIDGILQKAGLTHTACFKPEVVTEMRCYALFSIIDPTLAAGVAFKMARIAGLTGKEAVIASKVAETAEVKVVETAAKVEPKTSGNAQVDIWQAREAGQTAAANTLEKDLINDLKKSPIVNSVYVGEGITQPKLVKLQNGHQGIWKPSHVEGAKPDAEIIAYELDRHLGLNRVPVTVKKDLDGTAGTLQYYMDSTKKTKVDDPESFIFFDYLIENGDRHGGNYLIRDGRPIAIDHGFAFDPSYTPDFPKHVDSIITRQKNVESSLRKQKLELAKARKAKASEETLQSLESQVRETEKAVNLARIKASQEVTAMGITPEATAKLASTSEKQWNQMLKKLSPEDKKSFLARKDKALSAIKRASDYFGEGIYPAGQNSPLYRRPERLIKNEP